MNLKYINLAVSCQSEDLAFAGMVESPDEGGGAV
jgi:hypothetical protein